jgi:phosphoglycolate phosphatase
MDFKEKELIIFDLDGTLINSIPDITIAVNKMLTHYHLQALTIEEVTPFIGNGAKPLVKRALQHATKNNHPPQEFLDGAYPVFIAAYNESTCHKTFMYPHVLETLSYLKNKGYQMVICTNKPVQLVAPILEKLAIKSFFNCWIGEESLATKKPAAAPLLHLATLTNLTVEKCIMVGDSKNDILAAQNAGMESIGVNYGYNYNEKIADYNPTIVVDNFIALQQLF